MPCYFFHLGNGERITSDQEEEFPDEKAALQEAKLIARDLSNNQIGPIEMR
jgi:hypothetical protein